VILDDHFDPERVGGVLTTSSLGMAGCGDEEHSSAFFYSVRHGHASRRRGFVEERGIGTSEAG